MPTLGTENGKALAKRRLQSLAEGLGETDVADEVDQAALLLRAQLPDLPDYSALTQAQKAYYDVATGLRAATVLLAPAILMANNGQAKLKTPEFEYTFNVPSLAEREGWQAEISQAVGYLVTLAQSLATPSPARPRMGMFGAAGVARARARREYSLSGLLRLYVPGGWLYAGAFTIFPDGERPGDGCGLQGSGLNCDGLGEGV